MEKPALQTSFTLIEFLVVTLIMAVLALAVFLIVNPGEVAKRGRDAARIADLAKLQQVITNVLCVNTVPPCRGFSNTDSRVPNGTGWLKANISTQKDAAAADLPVDPVNSTAYHYTYCSDGNSWEIAVRLESQKSPGMLNGRRDDWNLYRVGTNLNLISPPGMPNRSLCVY